MDESLNKFDRIVAILIQLQSKKIVRAQDLADRFNVSLRTIYRDIRSLESSGVPIYSEAGIGYSIMDGYRLPPIMFTREEASSFIAAEKLMQKFTDTGLDKHYKSAMFKLKAVLKNSDKDWLDAIESKVVMQSNQQLFNENVPNALALFFESIAEKKQTLLSYQTFETEEINERRIEPVGIFHQNNFWYVLGYCHLRNDYRQFRTDRIQKIWKTDLDFTLEHKTLDELLHKENSVHSLTKVRILVDKKISRYLSWERKQYGFVSEKKIGSQVEMTFMCSEMNNGFSRWFLMFADHADILEPQELRDRVLELLDMNKKRLLQKKQS
ncbi:helix-turn-helix transcriptional regulator [Flavobacterium terrae]|uniref:Predicted DNA-binding transcriptional regulator YafY, contains an HTH and WYL domains n=1 Tax=Flavobacterium terrae TaxID=415425 RepID=A0A1M6AHV4_9FLAO|nr:YafY family protein [Flavobacterium terrae]SHI35793.1 Predicted DNA-binding transcriptional regulator YafY, contains an HTH and WYL domains [Flavobacterium terrae]